MSDSKNVSGSGTLQSPVPRAVIHKQILDRARARPDASLEEIASGVSGASMDLVERVLDEYGDPAENTHATAPEQTVSTTVEETDTIGNERRGSATTLSPDETETTMSEQNPRSSNAPDPEQLTRKQLDVLRVINDHPTATQRELAKFTDVSSATISKRVNAIDGFDWEQRQEFVEAVFENGMMDQEKSDEKTTTEQNGNLDDLDALADRVEKLEAYLGDGAETKRSVVADPDLVHKILHACLTSDNISEEEELQIVKTFVRSE